MINGMTTTVQRDGWLFHDQGRPFSGPAIFATREQMDRFLETAGQWPDRIVRQVTEGDIVPLHHHRSAYWGFSLTN